MKLKKFIDYIICKIAKIEINISLRSKDNLFYTRDESYSCNPFIAKNSRTYIWIENKDEYNK